MKKIRVLSMLTTVSDIIFALLCLLFALVSFSVLGSVGDFAGSAVEHISDIDKNSIAAGYELLLTAFGLFGGVIGTILVYAAIFMGFSLFGFFAIPSIVGIVTYAKGIIPNSYKKDAIVKMIFNGIPFVILLWSAITEFSLFEVVVLVPLLIFGALTALSILQFIRCRKVEEISA